MKTKRGYFKIIIEGRKKTTTFHFFDNACVSLGAVFIEGDLSGLYNVSCLVIDSLNKVLQTFDRSVTDEFKLQQWLKVNKAPI